MEEANGTVLHQPKVNVRIFNATPWGNPKYETAQSSGFDLRAFIDEDIVLKPNQRHLIPTGIYLELPALLEVQVRPRSGLANEFGISIVNTPGTIDSDYRGQLHVNLINLGNEDFVVSSGMRIAQGVLVPVFQAKWEDVSSVDELAKTERADKGHGHTGV